MWPLFENMLLVPKRTEKLPSKGTRELKTISVVEKIAMDCKKWVYSISAGHTSGPFFFLEIRHVQIHVVQFGDFCD